MEKEQSSLLIVNLLDEPKVDADYFEFRISLRMTSNDEGDPCNPISVIITGSADVFYNSVASIGEIGGIRSTPRRRLPYEL